jgi:P pilus assembly chaperone PapD
VVLKEGITLTTQTMQRINFTPVPTDDGKKNRARVTIGQNIPVILSPASLPLNTTPWQGLTAQRAGTSLFINNPTPYIVRLTTQIDLLPGKTRVELPKTYILPHESITLALPQGASHAQSLRLHPVTRFGILTAPYELRL